MRNDIRDRSGRVLGYEQTRGSQTSLYRADGYLLGSYDSRDNATRGRDGRLITRGNTLSSLL